MSGRSTVVSCPGKVLMAGGYLVLEPENGGLVVGTASRFYTVVQEEASPSSSREAHSRASCRTIVNSPQFLQATWTYDASFDGAGRSVTFNQVDDGASKNPFVAYAIEAVLKVAAVQGKLPSSDLKVSILGDNDFYSQAKSTAGPSSGPKPFAPLHTTLADVHKTGLGSSAAMVTSLVAALLLHLSCATRGGSSLDKKQLALVHNIAQYAHSRAQGKVGSGFDVSSAVYGSQIYYRFSPQCLEDLLDDVNPAPHKVLDQLSPESALWMPSNATAGRVEPFSLPPMTTMILADVDAGSNTPSMVKAVLKWKSSHIDSSTVWQSIARLNMQLSDFFRQLSALSMQDGSNYVATVKALASLRSSEWSPKDGIIAQLFCEARKTMTAIRQQMKLMGTAAQVPIEPDEQTRLLDTCASSCPGVLGEGVPGAGGYDAAWVLVLDDSDDEDISTAEEQVRQTWQTWREISVQALSTKARIRGASVTSSAEFDHQAFSHGLQQHDMAAVHGLEAAVSDRA